MIRPASVEDAGSIRRLIRQVRINPMGLDWRRFLVACAPDGRVIACGQIKPHEEQIRELASIAVAPAYRGKGLARMIITQLISDTPSPVYLMCRSNLQSFYERFGFAPVGSGEMPAYFKRMTHLSQIFTSLTRSAESILIMRYDK